MDIDIKAVEDYVIAYKIVYKLIIKNPISLEETNTLKRILGQYILCQVCNKLPDGLNSQFDVFICTECVNNHETILKKCFKTLYEVIGKSPLYDDICDDDDNRRMYDKLVTEASGVSHQILQFPLHSQESTEVILGQKKHIMLQFSCEAKHKNKNESSLERENLNSKDIYEQENSEKIEQGNLEYLEQGSSIEQENVTDKFNQNLEKVSELKDLGTAVSELRTKRHMQASNEEKNKKKKGSSIEPENLNEKNKPDQKISIDPDQGSSIEQENLNDKFYPEPENSEDSVQGLSNEQNNSLTLEKICDIIGIAVPNLTVNDEIQYTRKLRSHSNRGSQLYHLYHLYSENIEKVGEINNLDTVVSKLRTKRHMQASNEEKNKKKKGSSIEPENLSEKNKPDQKISIDPDQGSSIEQENLNDKFYPEPENSEDSVQGLSNEQNNSLTLEKICDIIGIAVPNLTVNDEIKYTRKLRSHSNRGSQLYHLYHLYSENIEKVGEIYNLDTVVSKLRKKKEIRQAKNETKHKKEKESSPEQ